MKLGLGTAQFGLVYGISNEVGKTPPEEVQKILDVAFQNGIRIIDTAPLYGTSEEVLGQCVPQKCCFAIVTKTPVFNKSLITVDDAQMLEDTFRLSLTRTRQQSLYGLLIHRVEDLLSEGGFLLMERMLKLKSERLINKIGISVYTGDQIDLVMKNYSIDLIQLPINILDQRLLDGGYIARLKGAGVEVHARSVFLQGLLLMDPHMLPSHFDTVREHLINYHNILRQNAITPIEAALSFIENQTEIDVVICGVNSHQHLKEIIQSVAGPGKNLNYKEFKINDESIINPSKWRI